MLVASLLLPLASNAQMAKDKCKFVGNVISNYVPATFDAYWNQVTPENSGKWGSVESTRDVMSWGNLDIAYNHAKTKGYPFRQHTFIWGSQFPSWIDNLSSQEQLEEITEWIRLYSERYPGTDFIDVVNEPINKPPIPGSGNFMGALGGGGVTGYDWIIKSFELARQYLPNAKLHINEYNILNNAAKTNQYKTVIMLLKERNLIDGIGLQAHGLENTDAATIKSNLDILATTGVPIFITEYDVDIADNQQQLEVVQEQFPIFWKHRSVAGITFWGYIQGIIWKPNAYLFSTSGTERPALTWMKNYISQNLPLCPKDGVTGWIEPADSYVDIYPNPVTGNKFTVVFEKPVHEARLLDFSCRKIAELDVKGKSSIEVNITEPAGLYLLQFSGGWGSSFKKLIIK